MHCHLALIKLLDHAKEIGILDYVNDDGGYWETRSADILARLTLCLQAAAGFGVVEWRRIRATR